MLNLNQIHLREINCNKIQKDISDTNMLATTIPQKELDFQKDYNINR